MFDQLAKLRPVVTYRFRAYPGQGQSVSELIHQMEQLGNKVVDATEEYVLCAVWQESSDRWGCLLCLGTGAVVVLDSQEELSAHLDIAHPGWNVNDKGEPVV